MSIDLSSIRNYFKEKLEKHGATPLGVDWNSSQAQEIRFTELIRLVDQKQPFTIMDYGCGFGALNGWLRKKGWDYQYTGYDILDDMVQRARELYKDDPRSTFTSHSEELNEVDYVIACGIFNLKLEFSDQVWTEFVIGNLHEMHRLSRKGFAFNLLTKYSDPEFMKPQLYYPDPCFYFDYCKRNFSRNVALLHDYNLYDFAIIVRK